MIRFKWVNIEHTCLSKHCVKHSTFIPNTVHSVSQICKEPFHWYSSCSSCHIREDSLHFALSNPCKEFLGQQRTSSPSEGQCPEWIIINFVQMRHKGIGSTLLTIRFSLTRYAKNDWKLNKKALNSFLLLSDHGFQGKELFRQYLNFFFKYKTNHISGLVFIE